LLSFGTLDDITIDLPLNFSFLPTFLGIILLF
jgi:hypothetical protein